MNSISNLTPRNVAPLETPATVEATELKSRLQSLNLTIVSGPGGIEGPGGEIRIRLENPTIGPEDIPLNEFLQQLDSLGKTPSQVFMLGEAVKNLTDGTLAIAQGMLATQANGSSPDPALVQAQSSAMEQQATFVEASIRDIIENSTYPSFSDFLKELVRISQDLREAAAKARLASIEGNYSMMMSAADQMVTAANKARESREAQIEADKMEAIGQIVAGVATAVIVGAFAIGGGVSGGLSGISTMMPVGSSLSQASSSIITGSFSVSVTNKKLESSDKQAESDLANVAKQRLEAAAKLIEAQTEVARELGEIAKGLRDMVLKLTQDFISSQNQVIQRANV